MNTKIFACGGLKVVHQCETFIRRLRHPEDTRLLTHTIILFKLSAVRSEIYIYTHARTNSQSFTHSLNSCVSEFFQDLRPRHWRWGVILGPGNSLSPLTVKAKRGWGGPFGSGNLGYTPNCKGAWKGGWVV